MKANTIEEFFGTLQQSTVEAWKKHLKTDKYSNHIALNDFYEDIVELVDTLIEDYMGIYGKIKNYKNLMTTDEMSAIEYLKELRDLCKTSSKELFDEDDTELFSDIDEIVSLIDSTLYKLKELKESENRTYRNSLIEHLNSKLGIRKINEARNIIYDVSFLGTKDEDGVPYTVSIYVNKEYQKNFEDFLEDEQDNIFHHAEGGQVEY